MSGVAGIPRAAWSGLDGDLRPSPADINQYHKTLNKISDKLRRKK